MITMLMNLFWVDSFRLNAKISIAEKIYIIQKQIFLCFDVCYINK